LNSKKTYGTELSKAWVAKSSRSPTGCTNPGNAWEKFFSAGNESISHLRKKKIIFKHALVGDMLVPWRVVDWQD